MTTWISANVNRKDRLLPELLSRFVTFDFKPCTRKEFLDVAQEVITGQLGKDPEPGPLRRRAGGPAYQRRPPGHPGGQALQLAGGGGLV